MDITAVTSIGGKGTRISSLSGDLPKGLLEINGKTVLFRIAEKISFCGIKNLILLRGYKSEFFENEILKIENQLNIKISSFIEKEPLGECGGLWHIKDQIFTKDLLFVLGDIVFDIYLLKFIDFHYRLDSNFSLISHTTSHPEDSDLIRAPNGVQITDFKFKNQFNKYQFKGFLGNAGISLFKKNILDIVKPSEDKENKTTFKNLAYEYFKISGRVFSYNTSEYIKDIGTPERLKKVINDDKKNLIARRNYTIKQKCLFLDRDNTLIRCKRNSYILKEDDIQIRLDKIPKLIKLRDDFDLCIIITNQPQVAMGFLSIDNLYNINSVLITKLLELGLKIDDISYCPHHPHQFFEGEIKVLKHDCFCRKPNPGMLLHQAFLKNIDLKTSLLIGDSDSDKFAAQNAGTKFINIEEI